MKEELLVGDRTPGLESLHQLRLTALLRDVVKRKGRMEAAVVLRVNYKTLAAAIDSGKLTPRLCDALERLLLIRELAALEEVRGLVGELEGRLKAVEDMAQTASGKVEEMVGCQLGRPTVEPEPEAPNEERHVRMEQPRREEGATNAPVGDQPRPRSSPPRHLFRSTSPSVVTMEPQPGDEEVYGSAWSLVEKWRRLRQSHPAQGRGLHWLVNEERLRALEIALIGQHELTMPPDTDPWDSLGRRTQVRWRTRTQERVRRERVRDQVRRWFRRVLTLELWRK